jgi:hypothetical protein
VFYQFKGIPVCFGIFDTNKLLYGVFFQIACEEHDAAINGREVVKVEFQPVYRSGVWSDTGRRPVMEDAHVRIDDLETHLGPEGDREAAGAFYGVFDGHGGKDAASYVKENVLRYILDDVAFPTAVEDAMRSAFLRLDDAFAKACSVNHDLSSGTTALTALLSGRFVLLICSCLSRFLHI